MADERFPITPPAETHDFVRRVLRWLAVVCVAVGALRAVSFIVQSTSYRWWWPSFYYSAGLQKLEVGLRYIMVAGAILLLIGGVALVRWKSWSRTILLIWAAVAILSTFTSNAIWFSRYVMERAASTQPAFQPSIALMGWYMLANWIDSCAFPVVVAAVLLQPEVAHLWARLRGGGFDVVPFAAPVSQITDR